MAVHNRKPVPKKQHEISTGNITPFDDTRGNPNSPQQLNRGEKVSVKDDTGKAFSLGIQDVDEAIVYYFENVIQPNVVQNGQRIEVPVMYGSPERWKSIQKDGFLRDQKGKLMSPLIIFQRNTITPIRTLANKVDANHPINFAYYPKQYSKTNTYDKFNLLNNRKPVKELQAIVVPDYVQIAYTCKIHTYYMDQLNKIVEDINYANDTYWGNPERFKFKASIDSFNTAVSLQSGDERIVTADFGLTLYGYLVPNNIQKNITTDPKIYSKAQVVVTNETVGDIDSVFSSGSNYSA